MASYPGELAGVSALSPTDAWAVGYSSAGSGAYKALILRWNGSVWTRVTSPLPGEDSLLNGVTALSPSDAWAVGYYETTSGGFRTLVLKWSGTRWAQVPSPSS